MFNYTGTTLVLREFESERLNCLGGDFAELFVLFYDEFCVLLVESVMPTFPLLKSGLMRLLITFNFSLLNLACWLSIWFMRNSTRYFTSGGCVGFKNNRLGERPVSS